MTHAEEIRWAVLHATEVVKDRSHGDSDAIICGMLALIAYTIGEIAAQLAELIELKKLEAK